MALRRVRQCLNMRITRNAACFVCGPALPDMAVYMHGAIMVIAQYQHIVGRALVMHD